jgi:uncharacterized protein (DUF1800 family)
MHASRLCIVVLFGAFCAAAGAANDTPASAAALPTPAARGLDMPLGIDDARLLLTRTGFGASPAEIADFAPLTRRAAVERLLRATVTRAATPPPPELVGGESLRYPGRDASEDERRAFRREQVREGLALRAWWLDEMLVTPSPLTERMTLFWHGHFATSQQKVRLTALMYRQNLTLRANAVGNFATLLHAVAKDPAMLIYLDGVQNRRDHPNENFAREVMELFTLGEGHYTEQDIKEAARAFTGWSIDRASGTFVARPRLHDNAQKMLFGAAGNFDGDGALDRILARPQVAVFVTTKLWKEFVSPDPDAAAIARIAAHFRASGYDIKTALRDLFDDDAMYAPSARASETKSPVDLVAGTLHTLDMLPGDLRPYAVACAGMGQNLFSPPNVRGWPGGTEWINSQTLLLRKQFVERITRSELFGQAYPGMTARAGAEGGFDVARWLAAMPAGTGGDARAQALRVLLPMPPVDGASVRGDAAGVIRTAMQDATFQLE